MIMLYIADDLSKDDFIDDEAKMLVILLEWRLWAEAQVDLAEQEMEATS